MLFYYSCTELLYWMRDGLSPYFIILSSYIELVDQCVSLLISIKVTCEFIFKTFTSIIVPLLNLLIIFQDVVPLQGGML
jgi:hypothetical protein